MGPRETPDSSSFHYKTEEELWELRGSWFLPLPWQQSSGIHLKSLDQAQQVRAMVQVACVCWFRADQNKVRGFATKRRRRPPSATCNIM
eukprot:scaffold217862_cov19-Tisochrysis_lutea.AAC.1